MSIGSSNVSSLHEELQVAHRAVALAQTKVDLAEFRYLQFSPTVGNSTSSPGAATCAPPAQSVFSQAEAQIAFAEAKVTLAEAKSNAAEAKVALAKANGEDADIVASLKQNWSLAQDWLKATIRRYQDIQSSFVAFSY